MTGTAVLLRKELLESWRTLRLPIVTGLFLVVGLSSPLLARFLPQIIEAAAGDQLPSIPIPTPVAADAADQLWKNVAQFGAIAAIVLAMASVAGEKERGTAAFVLSKTASRGAFLAAKISFVNEMALLAEAVGADIREIREGMIADSRIGDQFLFPGLGFGGSCFPKDVHSLIHQGAAAGVELRLAEATRRVNQRQKTWPLQKLRQALGHLTGKTICLWGLAFKPNTDEVREAPAVTLIEEIARAGGRVRAYDPVAAAAIRARLGPLIADGTLTLLEDAYAAAEGCHALVVVTEWQEFRTPNFLRLRSVLKTALIVDGRNIYDPSFVKRYGFVYHGVGLGVPV